MSHPQWVIAPRLCVCVEWVATIAAIVNAILHASSSATFMQSKVIAEVQQPLATQVPKLTVQSAISRPCVISMMLCRQQTKQCRCIFDSDHSAAAASQAAADEIARGAGLLLKHCCCTLPVRMRILGQLSSNHTHHDIHTTHTLSCMYVMVGMI